MMAFRDQLSRLILVIAVFAAAAVFFFPWRRELAYYPSSSSSSPSSSKQAAAPPPHDSVLPSTPTSSYDNGDGQTPPVPASTLRAGETLSPFALTSPSGRYTFRLLPSGSLSLRDGRTGAELFSSDTAFHWPVQWDVSLGRDGVLRLSWANASEAPFRGTPWVSSMLPGCDTDPDPDQAAAAAPDDDSTRLELLDSGMLRIVRGDGERTMRTTCTLRRAADDRGRLAIVYAGFLRTYLATCADHDAKLVRSWTGSGGADVHVFTYLEEAFHPPFSSDEAKEKEHQPVTEEAIKANLRACFGDALKSVTITTLSAAHEDLPPSSSLPPELTSACPLPRLQRQLDQWRALYLASLQLRRYTVAHGVRYDYVFRGRLDLALWGDIPPLSSLEVPEGGVVAPRVAPDWPWYSALHDGELRAGVTDIAAFGRTAAMYTWLGLYREFLGLRGEEKAGGMWKGFNTHVLGPGAKNESFLLALEEEREEERRKKQQGGGEKETLAERCTPEGILAYWLGVNGVPVRTDWRFRMGLLRRSGEVVFTCPAAGRGWLCPGFIPNVREDGTLYH